MPTRIRDAARAAYEVGKDAVSRYGRDRGGRMAAALAYRTLFAIAPLLLLATGVFGLVIGDAERAREFVLDAIGTVVGPAAAEAIETLVVSAVEASDATTVIGLGLFAWASSSLFMDLQMSLNDIFGVPRAKVMGWRAFVRRRLISVAWSLSFGVILIALWIVGAAGGWIAELIPEGFGQSVVSIGTRLIPLVLLPAVFAVMYRTMTRAELHTRALMVGGLVTSAVFLITAIAAGIYFAWDTGTPAGQVAGSVVVLLLLAYFLSSSILMGAEITRAHHDRLMRQ